MSRKLIPTKDQDFNDFQDNLVAQAVNHQAAWNLVVGDITSLQALQADWDAAWDIAKNKTNRTKAQVEAKDLARETYELALRNFIQRYIVLNLALTSVDLELCGIAPRDTSHAPIPVPATLPVVDSLPDAGHRVKIFFRQQPDAEGVSRRGKPEGVKFCEFAINYDTVPPTPEDCQAKISARRSPEMAEFTGSEAGKKVFYFARWVNVNGEAGPWTDMNQFMVP